MTKEIKRIITFFMLRPLLRSNPLCNRLLSSILSVRNYAADAFPTIPEYESKWTQFFANSAYDQFELQRGLNKAFAYDIVPTIAVLEAALRAARRLNDYGAAMRIFGALRQKCIDDKQYEEYVKYLEPIKQELGVSAPEDIGRI
jgi:cytochrome c oxidase subunit 5a